MNEKGNMGTSVFAGGVVGAVPKTITYIQQKETTTMCFQVDSTTVKAKKGHEGKVREILALNEVKGIIVQLHEQDGALCLSFGADSPEKGESGEDSGDSAASGEIGGPDENPQWFVLPEAVRGSASSADASHGDNEGSEAALDGGKGFTETSGQKASAKEGAVLIAELIRRSQGRIEILPAAGINPATVMEVIERTGCNQVHASLRLGGKRAEPVDPGTEFSGGGTRTDGDAVVSMRRFLG
jgi:hypothetical protein